MKMLFYHSFYHFGWKGKLAKLLSLSDPAEQFERLKICFLSTYYHFIILTFFLLRGVGAGCNTKEVIERLRYLEAEIEELEIKEKELDQQKLWLQQSIKNVKEDSINKRYPLICSIIC